MTDNNYRLSFREVLPVFFVYLLVTGLGLYHHALWLDEAHHFLIGRDSDSPASLYYNMRYDGHPRLWNWLIWFVTHYITRSYVGLQVLHLLFSASAVFIFLRYAPFNIWTKILILSGYYFIFEFSVVSRNYTPGILLLFSACALLREPRKNLLWIGLLLFLMCNIHLFFAFAAMGIYFYLLVEAGKLKAWLTPRFLLMTLFFLVGFFLTIIQTRTPPEENFHPVINPADWVSVKNLSFAGFALIKGWLPIPQARGGHFWNSYWLNPEHIGHFILIILVLFFLVMPGVALKKDKKALVFYYVSLFWILFFFIVTQQTGARYFGMVFIYFIAALWLAAYGSAAGAEDVFSVTHVPGSGKTRQLVWAWIFVVLALNTLIGLFALEQGFTRPFSPSKNVVQYIQSLQPAGEEIVVEGYITGPTLSAYLGHPVFYLATGQEGSYVIWKTGYFPVPRPSVGQEMARWPVIRGFGEFILVSNKEEDTADIHTSYGNYRLVPLKSFDNGIVKMETYYVYRVVPF